MKKNLLSVVLLFIVCLAKAQQTDTVMAKLGKLPNTNYELPPRVGVRFLTDHIAGKIAVPSDMPSNSADAVVALHIDSNGIASNVRLVKSFSPAVDSSIMHAFSSLSAIKPAQINGRNVMVDFVIGIRFGKVRWDDRAIQAICYAFTPIKFRDPDNSEMVFVAVQTPPSFPGGTSAFNEFLKKNLVYPQKAKARHIKGTVIITFVVRKDGSVSDLLVLRSPDDDLSGEALRVMHNCPAFIPGMQNGRAVNCSYMVPVGFN